MEKKRFRPRRDTLLVLASLTTLAGFLLGSGSAGSLLAAGLQKFGIVSASLGAPDSGMLIVRQQMDAVFAPETAGTTGEGTAPVPEVPAEAPTQAADAAPAYDENDAAAAMALIPEARRGAIEQTQFASVCTGDNYFTCGAGCGRNATDISTAELQSIVDAGAALHLERGTNEPQVLVVHTHSTESYDRFDAGFYDKEYPTRTTDSASNVLAVGEALCAQLQALGIAAVHATEYHDYPSYENSYSRSRVTVQNYLAKYPSIKLVLDIHRDGIQREDGTRVKPTVTAEGKKTAQIMIVAGAGTDEAAVPCWQQNLQLAARLQNSAERSYPGFARPLLFAYRFYNQDLVPGGSLLVEVGSESNTLGEASSAMALLARAIADACP